MHFFIDDSVGDWDEARGGDAGELLVPFDEGRCILRESSFCLLYCVKHQVIYSLYARIQEGMYMIFGRWMINYCYLCRLKLNN